MSAKTRIPWGCISIILVVLVAVRLTFCGWFYPSHGTPGETTFSSDGTSAIHYVTESTAIVVFQGVDMARVVQAWLGPTPDYRSAVAAHYGEFYVDYAIELAVAGRIVFGGTFPRNRKVKNGNEREYFMVREGVVTFYETLEELKAALAAIGLSDPPPLLKPGALVGMKERS